MIHQSQDCQDYSPCGDLWVDQGPMSVTRKPANTPCRDWRRKTTREEEESRMTSSLRSLVFHQHLASSHRNKPSEGTSLTAWWQVRTIISLPSAGSSMTTRCPWRSPTRPSCLRPRWTSSSTSWTTSWAATNNSELLWRKLF